MNYSRLGLKEHVTLERIDLFAYDNNWSFQRIIMQSDLTPYEKIWMTSDKLSTIHYIDDFLIGIRYLVLEGENSSLIASSIQSLVDTYNLNDLRQLISQAITPDQFIYAIYLAGVLAPSSFEEEIFGYFELAFGHDEPNVRRAAIFATAYVAWSQFRERLEHLAVNDSELAVRDYASLMLTSHIKHAWGK